MSKAKKPKASPELMRTLDAISKTEFAPIKVPITAEWLRSLGYKAFKNHRGEYSDHDVKLIYRVMHEWKGERADWWALDFDQTDSGWTVMLSAYDEGKFATLIQLANVHSQSDVLLLLRVLEKPERESTP